MMPHDTLAVASTDTLREVHRLALHSGWARVVVIALGYTVTLGLSGHLVRFFVLPPAKPVSPAIARATRFDSGAVIGKCENILALTFILAGDTTALGLLFAAKSLVRGKEIEKDAPYFLGGFLVNVVWSVLMGYLLRWFVVG